MKGSEGARLLALLSISVSLLLFVTARPGVILFVGANQGEAVAEGVAYMQSLCFFYIFSYIGSSFVGFYRGTGRINIPFIGTTLQISVRVVLSYWLAPLLGLKAVGLATGIGWISIVTFQLLVFSSIRRRERREEAALSGR
jgi:O-antigen/teichoic acid export membrane protein